MESNKFSIKKQECANRTLRFPIELLEINTFTKFSKEWALVSSGTKNNANTMTVSWGGVGVIWGKNVAYIFVRESRYTKELIDKTVEAVDKGSAMTETAAKGFGRIIEELEGFAEMAHSVNESATAQALALEQIEEGIEQISTVTQQNAASSEECSAISEELAARATELDTLVSKFRLHSKKK